MLAAVSFQGLASGAHPATTFPNAHLLAPSVVPTAQAKWSAPQTGSPLHELQQAVKDEDWTRDYEEGLTSIGMRADWSATPERCNFLGAVAASSKARRVLEIGSFCGVAALSLAESLPEDAQVHAFEIDPFVVKFGERFRAKSSAGRKITTHVGPAMASLERMADQSRSSKLQPFDFVVIDADKQGMRGYFDLLWKTPGLLSEHAVVCVDLTPFKGQPPLRYVKYGFPYTWEASSGQKQIDELRTHVAATSQFVSHEVGQLLVVHEVSANKA
eukprot:CAMPEP_0195064416 /NCGR_PEP_ID=MMETSP0448-20130528/10469_1 /TAXON_ID=66468 /ORGANISM="Heterocapsa triquestra, Strain CCMP 448" /LENGTH=271 /DNA_ID=CAMNT_0040095423 /DNA_START=73 /DNA_END=888 /DNA_ORIENTATION=-